MMNNRYFVIAFFSIFLFGLPVDAQQVSTLANDPAYEFFKTEFVLEARVTVGTMIQVGESKRGVRRIIPITGGTFSGPKLKGDILPGGDDWQLVRPDGDTELYARYLLKTQDGYIIQVINQALIHVDTSDKSFYCKSAPDFEAPSKSPYDFLNHALFLGTLTIPSLKSGETPYVIIKIFKVL
jgi:hypothetical protein